MRTRRRAVTLAVTVVAAVMALPAFAANAGTGQPYKNSGNQSGWFNIDTGGYYLVGPVKFDGLRDIREGSVVTSNPTGQIGAEVDIYTAANGEKLYAKGLENNLPTDLHCPDVPDFLNYGPFAQTVVYSGGTGRFAHLTGSTYSDGCLYFGAKISPDVYKYYVTFSETGTLSY
jgi:hypothetical protein